MAKNLKQQAAIAISMKAAGKKPKSKMAKAGKVATTPAQKKFAALAPPKDKITFADKIAGAKKKTTMKKGGKVKSKK
jgi:hypothetical protein